MERLVPALDHLCQRQDGREREKKVAVFEEGLMQMYFQLVRRAEAESRVREQYCSLIEQASRTDKSARATNFLLSLMVQTRDIHGGKGEYRLFYVMLECWDRPGMQHWSDATAQKVRCIVERCFGHNTDVMPFGSWKDVKYLFEYYKEQRGWTIETRTGAWRQSPVLTMIADMVKQQIDKDCVSSAPSLLAKWLPREKSAFAWQVPIYAHAIHGHKHSWSALSGIGKASYLARYRRMLSRASRATGVVQRLQCSNEWRNINFAKDVTSLTLSRQSQAFKLEGRKQPGELSPTKLADRQQCRCNYLLYMEECRSGLQQFKARRVTIGELVRQAWDVPVGDSTGNADLQIAYDAKVEEARRTKGLHSMCALCDTSGSMISGNCPLFDAVGIAMLIAETSVVGPRIMTFSTQPRWIHLKPGDSFVQKVATIRELSHYAGAETNIYKAYALLLAGCQKAELSAEDVEALHLLVLSDMQLNEADAQFTGTLDESCKTVLRRGWGGGNTRAPRMVYWNMQYSGEFPTAVNDDNTGALLVSGYTTAVLAALCANGAKELCQLTPTQGVLQTLSADRYTFFWDV